MDEYDEDVHPLDRDYSLPSRARSEARYTYDPKLRKLGTITFAAGMIVMFLAAIVLSNFVGNRSVELFGSIAHKLGMVIGLIGGILVVAAYRWEQLKNLMQSSAGGVRSRTGSPFAVLFGMNAVGFGILVGVSYALQNVRVPMLNYIVFNATTSILCALMVTIAIRHRGFLQAYAIGVLAPLIMNTLSHMSLFAAYESGYRGNDTRYMYFANIATYLVCGLLCGGYVLLLDSAKRRDEV